MFFTCSLSTCTHPHIHAHTRAHSFVHKRTMTWSQWSANTAQQPLLLAKFVLKILIPSRHTQTHSRQWKTKKKATSSLCVCVCKRANEHQKWLIVGLKVSILFKSFCVLYVLWNFHSNRYSHSLHHFPFACVHWCVCVYVEVYQRLWLGIVVFHFSPKDELDRPNSVLKF